MSLWIKADNYVCPGMQTTELAAKFEQGYPQYPIAELHPTTEQIEPLDFPKDKTPNGYNEFKKQDNPKENNVIEFPINNNNIGELEKAAQRKENV